MTEITFLVHEAEEGGYHAEAAGFGIFAEGDTIAKLKESVRGGVSIYFEGSNKMPLFAHLHFVKDEIMAL